MSQKRVRRAIALDSEESNAEEREASRLLLLSSIGHALLDADDREQGTAESANMRSPNNAAEGFVMPLRTKVPSQQQHHHHVEASPKIQFHSKNSRDLVPHELPPDAFGEYPSLDINRAHLEVSNPVPVPMNRPPSHVSNALLHITRDPPAAYDDLFGGAPPGPTQPRVVHVAKQSNRPVIPPPDYTQSHIPVESSSPSNVTRPRSKLYPTLDQEEQTRPCAANEGLSKVTPDVAETAGASQPSSSIVATVELGRNSVGEETARVETQSVSADVVCENHRPLLVEDEHSSSSANGDLPEEVSTIDRLNGTIGEVEPSVQRTAVEQLSSNDPPAGQLPSSEQRELSRWSATTKEEVSSPPDLALVLDIRDDDASCFGPRPQGDLSPAAMGLVGDYVPGVHEVIDLDDSDSDESDATSWVQQRRQIPVVKESRDREETVFLEDKPSGTKQEVLASIDDESPREGIVMIDLQDGEDEEEDGGGGGGQLSPQGNAYSEISSMDDNAADRAGL